MCVCACTHVCVEREREGERKRGRESEHVVSVFFLVSVSLYEKGGEDHPS